jgi:hypothetical protein
LIFGVASAIPVPLETKPTLSTTEAVVSSPVVVEDAAVVVYNDCGYLTSEIGEAEDEIDRQFDLTELEYCCLNTPDAPGCKDSVQLKQPTTNLPLDVTPDDSPIVATKPTAKAKPTAR